MVGFICRPAIKTMLVRSCEAHRAAFRAVKLGSENLFSPSHRAVIRVYDNEGKVIKTHEHAGEFNEP